MAGQPGFFDADEPLKALSAAGDPLEGLRQVVDFELFRPTAGGEPGAPALRLLSSAMPKQTLSPPRTS